jgi:hypothetical protein
MGSMLTRITNLTVRPPFAIEVRFSDGSGGVHDFAQLTAGARNLLADLEDPAFFTQVRLDEGAPTWPNGFDVDPEWLRREMAAAGELHNVVAAE